jgi:sec-independent protein translocase protein TatB
VFDISFSELLVIGVIALVVIGPERLPKVARTVGHLLGRAQRYVSDVKGDIQREVELDELKKMKEEMENAARDMTSSMQETENSIRGSLDVKAVDDFAENAYQSNTSPTIASAAATDATTAAATDATTDATTATTTNTTTATTADTSTVATTATTSHAIPLTESTSPASEATATPSKPRVAKSVRTAKAKVPVEPKPDEPSGPTQEKLL